MAQWLRQSSIEMVVLDLARAHSSGGGIYSSVMKLKHFDFTYNAFPRVSLARPYYFPAFIFPNGMCNLQLGPTIIVAHIHQVHECAVNNTTSMGRLQVSKAISRKRNFPLLFCPLKLKLPFEWGGRVLGQQPEMLSALQLCSLPKANQETCSECRSSELTWRAEKTLQSRD